MSWHAQCVTRNEIMATILNMPSDFRAYELGIRYNMYLILMTHKSTQTSRRQ